MAHPRHEEIRRQYHCQCGYCGISEADSGGELTVDHFQPSTVGGDESDQNLVYSCFRCNSYKGDYFPTPKDLENGRRILHPQRDDVSQHYRENLENGTLEPLSPTGEFQVFLLRLNRPQLIEFRLRRRMQQLLEETRQLLQEENNLLKLRLGNLENYVRQLQLRIQLESGPEGNP